MKIICASDLHLGYERANYDKICDLFEIAKNGNFDQMVLCGDIFDLWRYPVAEISKTTMPGFKRALVALKYTAGMLPVVIIPGNHDYNLQKIAPGFRKEYNVIIRGVHRHEQYYFTHGWQFDVQQRLGSFAYGGLVTAFPYLYQRFFKKPAQMGLPINDRMNDQIRKTHWKAKRFARMKRVTVVMGHTHIPMISRYMINCGDFVDSCSYIVIENDRVELEYL